MKTKKYSYNLGNVPHTNIKDILRRVHHQLAHRRYSKINFVSFCEDICEIAEKYISAEKARKELQINTLDTLDTSDTVETIKQQKQILEEILFQKLVKTNESFNSLKALIDVIYLEDIQEGRVLIYDGVCSRARNLTEQSSQEKQKILISHKKVELSEFYPVGYNLVPPSEIRINNIFKTLKARAIVKSRGIIPKKTKRVDVSFKKSKYKVAYAQDTLIGVNLVRKLYEKYKALRHERAQQETHFVLFVKDLALRKLNKDPERFKELRTIDDYVRWVSLDPSFVPEPCDQTDDQTPFVDAKAEKNFFTYDDEITDFHKTIAITKEAKLYTTEEIRNKCVIFGGLREDSNTKDKTYPFQDISYLSQDKNGQHLLNGLEERKVEFTLPTISHLPHEFGDIILQFDNVDCCDDDDDDNELLDVY